MILLDMAGFLALVFVSLLLGLAINAFRAVPLPLVYQSKTERFLTSQLDAEIPVKYPFPVVPEVSLEDLKTLMRSSGLMLLDARPPPFYQRGHLTGALNLSEAAFRKDLERLQARLKAPGAKTFVVYCSEEDCDDGEIVAQALVQLGFGSAEDGVTQGRVIRVFKGGWDAWKAARLPVEKSD